ncbi:MAG: hypothetical protein Tsb0020_32510 [Haliangiales bacterium]
MFHTNESSSPTTAETAYSQMPTMSAPDTHQFAARYPLSESEIRLRMRVVDGSVGLELMSRGSWSALGPLDILDIAPTDAADTVVMRIADIVDDAGHTVYTAYGRTDAGCGASEWTREGRDLLCRLKAPPSAAQVNWIKFTIGAAPTSASVGEPAPFDPMAIVRKEG